MSDLQAATHLKGLVDKAKLNEKHVKIARIYKAKVASLTSERVGLQERAQLMAEEIERLKSDLKHTSSARTRAERREDEARTWAGACGGRWAEPGLMLDKSTGCASTGLGYDCCCADRQVLNAARLCKNKKEGGSGRASPVAAPMPKSVSF